MAKCSHGKYWEWMGTELKLSSNKYLIYSYIFGFCYENEDGICYPSQETIGKMFHLNRASVQRVLNSLKEDGLIGWECGRFEHKTNVYFVRPEPLWKFAEKYPDLIIVTPGIAKHSKEKIDEESSSNEAQCRTEKQQDTNIIPSREQITAYVKENYPECEKYIVPIETYFIEKSNKPHWLNINIPWEEEVEQYIIKEFYHFNRGDQINGRTL